MTAILLLVLAPRNSLNDPRRRSLLRTMLFATEYSTTALILYWASASPLQPLYLTVSSQLPLVSTMASKPRLPKGSDGLLPTLDVLIQALGVAGSTCGIPPAQIAIGSANALLTMIRVCPASSRHKLPTHVHPGLCSQQTGLRQPRGVLRRSMSSAWPRLKGETVGWTRRVRARSG